MDRNGAPARARERRAWLVLAAITLLACACRIPLLFHGIWRDEASTFFDVTAPTLAGTLREISVAEITPPVFFLLMRGWVALLGTSEPVLKLPAFVFGVALVPATYVLGRLFGSRGAALLAAGFAAFSLTAIALSTEARAYTLCALLGALAVALALRYLSSNAGPACLLGYIAAATSLVYVHYAGVVLSASFAFGALAFAARRAAWRKLALFEAANGLVASAILPWLPHAAGARNATFLERAGGTSFAGRFVEQFGFVLPVDFMHVQFAFLFVIALVVGIARYVLRIARGKRAGEAGAVAASLALLAGTGIETVLSLHEQRYMFVFTPLANALAAMLFCALLGPGFVWMRRQTMGFPPLRTAFGLALLAAAGSGIPTEARAFGRLYGADRSGIRRLVADAFPSLDARTLVVVAPDYLGPTMGYYLRDRPDLTLTGIPQWDSPAHPRCCGLDWRDARMVDIFSRRIIAAARDGYSGVAYVWDLGAYDEGPVRYSKVFEVRSHLARALTTASERRYDGSKERIGMTLFRARTP